MRGIFNILAYEIDKTHQPSPDIWLKQYYSSTIQLKMAQMCLHEDFTHHKIEHYLPVKIN